MRPFDVYRGEQVGAGRKSIAFAVTFQSAERTLSDADAAALRGRIVETLAERFGTAMRGEMDRRKPGPIQFSRVEVNLRALSPGNSITVRGDGAAPNTRQFTFLYFFALTPQTISDAEIRVHNMRIENGRLLTGTRFQSIHPQSNMLMLFRDGLSYDLRLAESSRHGFANNLFIVHGWLRR